MNTYFEVINQLARTQPERTALIDTNPGHRFSYAELSEAVKEAAKKLTAIGVRPKDIIVVFASRSVKLSVYMLAASYLGAPAFSAYRDPEGTLAYTRRVLPPKFVLHDQVFDAPVRAAIQTEVRLSFDEIEALPPAALNGYAPDEHTPLYYNSTSGTTGLPKIVAASHKYVLFNARTWAQASEFTAESRLLCTFNLHWHDTIHRPLAVGGTAVLMHEDVLCDPTAAIRVVAEHQVTHLIGNPMFYRALINYCGEGRIASLRVCECGGAPTAETLKRQFSRKFDLDLLPVYGSTETSGAALVTPIGAPAPEGSVGRPLPGYEVSIVSPDGAPVMPNHEGELIISGPGVAESYLNPDVTEPRLRKNTFFTGDQAHQDEQGTVFVTGRISNQFKVGSVAVNAEEIERAMLHCSLVEQVAVAPIPDSVFGYVPGALIFLKEPIDFDPKTERLVIDRIVRDSLPYLKEPFLMHPRHIQWTPHSLPVNGMGKLDRAAIRNLFLSKVFHRTKVRLPRWMLFRLAAQILQNNRSPLIKLFLKHPVGTVKSLFKLWKGDKDEI